MKNKILSLLIGIGVASCLVVSSAAMGASINYYLDRSNKTNLFPDGTDYLQVTIDDLGLANGKIYFTVTPLEAVTAIVGSNLRIDRFAFNGEDLVDNNILPGRWSLINNQTVSIFGKFDNILNGRIIGRHNFHKRNSFLFSIDAPNDTVESYVAALSNDSSAFAVHLTGRGVLNKAYPIHAYFGAGSSVPPSEVPIPPAAWLLASGMIGLIGIGRRHTLGKRPDDLNCSIEE